MADGVLRPWDVYEMKIMEYGASAVAILVFDTLICLEDELDLVWDRHRPITMQVLYVFCRYIMLAVQIVNLVLTFYFHSTLYVSDAVCQFWYLGRIIVSQSLLLVISLVGMIRAYAMTADNRRLRVKAVFISTLVVELGLIVVRIQSSWKNVKYTVGCLMTYQPDSAVWIGLGTFFTNLAIVVVIFGKTAADCPREWRKNNILTRVKLDSIIAALIITVPAGVASFIYPTSARTTYLNSFVGAFYSAFSTVLSAFGVRLITNIWAAAETETQIEDVELTSAIELAFTTTDEQASSNAPRPKDKIHPTS